MIVVRETFIAKPGMASKLATMFKDQMAKESPGSKVMTDMTGVFNKVVIETEYPDLAAFDRDMQEFMKRPMPKPDPSKATHVDMYREGKREIFRVWQ